MKIRERNVRRFTRKYGQVIGSERVGAKWILAEVTSAQVTQAITWYPNAGYDCEDIAEESGISLAQACGVVAAWSPRMRWSKNLEVARQHLQGKKNLGLSQSARRADNVLVHGIEALDTPTGPKTYNFAWNLFGDYYAVTIDIWMMSAAGLDTDRPTGLQYRELASAVRRLAKRHNMQPAEMQALIWIAARGSAE